MATKNITVRNIPLADIQPSTLNPRKTFDQDSLNELAESIKENGLVQPITLRKTPKGSEKHFEIVCGERRYRASILAGLDNIQAVVKDLDDKKAFAAMIIENLQRKDVDPMEEAAAFSKLFTDGTMKVKEIAKMLGKSQSYVISRINLANIIPQFVELMNNKTLYLVHLLDICRLTKEQQKTLFNSRFQPSSIERWTKKILPMDVLHQWIDEDVMKYLDTARFNLTDESFSCGHNCINCPFNTKNKEEYANEKRDRCMNPACFNEKTKEFIFREAKNSGLPVIYIGKDNDAILEEAKKFGLEPIDYTGRQYVKDPEEPDKSKFNDEECYEKRMQTYRHVKAIFDSNIEDGTVEKVYEICYDGKMSGELKYAYSIPDDLKGKTVKAVESDKERITTAKSNILKYKEAADAEIVENERQAFAASPYSSRNTVLSANETKVFHALLLKFISYSFKKEIGLSWENSENAFKKGEDIIEKNRNAIKREFIKSMLSEQSVNYSHDLAGMLKFIMNEQFPDDAEKITKEAYETRDKKIEGMEKWISELKGETKDEEAPVVETKEEESKAEAEETPQVEPEEKPAEEAPTNEESQEVSAEVENTKAEDTEETPSDGNPQAEQAEETSEEAPSDAEDNAEEKAE